MYVGVIGAGECTPETYSAAERVGGLIARRGGVVVCGGLGGVMEAASKGASRAGGLVVGILPGTGRRGANPYLTVSVVTGMGEARNALVARSSDVLLAISGGYGTLSEIALGLKMGIPVVSLDSWKALSREGVPIAQASTPEEAVELAFSLGQSRREFANE